MLNFIPMISKLHFQHHYFSVSWSFRNHSNVMIWRTRNI